MANKMITLPDELILKLRGEDNASGLIQVLLFQYYSKSENNSQKIIQEVKEKIIENEEKTEFKKVNDEATKKLKNAILGELNDGFIKV